MTGCKYNTRYTVIPQEIGSSTPTDAHLHYTVELKLIHVLHKCSCKLKSSLDYMKHLTQYKCHEKGGLYSFKPC